MTKICYFSGTGNTKWSAVKIAEALSDKYELINIGVESDKKEIILEADAVVLLFPSYAYGLPIIVNRFIEKAVFKTPYIASFVTFGTSPGGTLAEACRILKRKGINAAYWGRIPAVENYIAIFGPPKPATCKKRLQLQRTATEEAAHCVAERRTNSISTFCPFSSFVSTLFSLGVKIFYKWYKVSADCDGCGDCEKVCPVGAITVKAGYPVFSKKCEHCQGCLNYCPKKAIQFGRLKHETPRYHHPDIGVDEIAR